MHHKIKTTIRTMFQSLPFQPKVITVSYTLKIQYKEDIHSARSSKY